MRLIKICILFISVILSSCEADAQTYYSNPSILFGGAKLQMNDDFIPVLVTGSPGQSNDIGRAEYDRLEKGTKYTYDPTKVYIYHKTSETSADDGTFVPLQIGTIYTRELGASSVRHYGAYCIAGIKLAEMLNKNVYIIKGGFGGTVLNRLGVYPSWHPLENQRFDILYDYNYQVALDKLQAANPGKRIVVWRLAHLGETDAIQTRTQAQFYADLVAHETDARQYELLGQAPLFAAKINYMQTADETVINDAWTQYATANPSYVKLIETSDLPRKIDLTVGEKLGITATSTDDEHLSYIAQNTKADRIVSAIFAYQGWTEPSIAASSTNTGFDPSTINAGHVRLQGTSGKVTLETDTYRVTALTNDLSTGTFSVTSNNVFYKEDSRKGWLFWPDAHTGVANVPRIQTSAAVGTTLFAHSFSYSAWVKPRDGQPAINYTLIHDIQNTGSINNSRFSVTIATTGKIVALLAIGGTAVQAITDQAVFADNIQTVPPKHIAVTVTSGDFIRIYVDGVLQTLDAVNNGNISALTLANYTNGTNVLTIGAVRQGASTYNSYFKGHMREITIQPVVYSTTDIANLMLN